MRGRVAVHEDRRARKLHVPPFIDPIFNEIAPVAAEAVVRRQLRRQEASEIAPVQRPQLHNLLERSHRRSPHPRLIEPAARAHVPRVQAGPALAEIRIGGEEVSIITHDVPFILIVEGLTLGLIEGTEA